MRKTNRMVRVAGIVGRSVSVELTDTLMWYGAYFVLGYIVHAIFSTVKVSCWFG